MTSAGLQLKLDEKEKQRQVLNVWARLHLFILQGDVSCHLVEYSVSKQHEIQITLKNLVFRFCFHPLLLSQQFRESLGGVFDLFTCCIGSGLSTCRPSVLFSIILNWTAGHCFNLHCHYKYINIYFRQKKLNKC